MDLMICNRVCLVVFYTYLYFVTITLCCKNCAKLPLRKIRTKVRIMSMFSKRRKMSFNVHVWFNAADIGCIQESIKHCEF